VDLIGRDADRQLARRLERAARAASRAAQREHVAQVRAAHRHRRAVARAWRRLPWYGLGLVGSSSSALVLGETGLVVGAVGFVSVLGLVRSVSVLVGPPSAAPPAPALPVAPPAPPPDPRSAAWPAVRRLETVRWELVRLLPLVAPAGRVVADEAWHAAGEADAALRWQAARLCAVEPYRGADPELMRPLYAGVEAQERLVLAVADLVAASADPLATARLQDATDALHGLAQGLREVR
jgi:hypothetical protein